MGREVHPRFSPAQNLTHPAGVSLLMATCQATRLSRCGETKFLPRSRPWREESVQRFRSSRRVKTQRAPIDLYVGSMADFALPPELPEGRWQRLRGVSSAQLRAASEGAFELSDPMDRKALESILSHFPRSRDSLLDHSWMLVQGDQPVGLCLVSKRHYLTPDRALPYVDLVAVRPGDQRKGVASALLFKSGKSLWDDGYRELLHAHIRRGNSASEALFRRLGFLLWHKDCEQGPVRPKPKSKPAVGLGGDFRNQSLKLS